MNRNVTHTHIETYTHAHVTIHSQLTVTHTVKENEKKTFDIFTYTKIQIELTECIHKSEE